MFTLIHKTYFLFLTLIFCLPFGKGGGWVSAQEKFTISGYIKEAATGESSIGANVYLQKKNSEEERKGVVTNAYGFFSITLEKGDYQMTVKYLGFNDYT